MGFWGIEVKPGKPYSYHSDDVEGRVYITQATLGDGSSSEKCILQCSARNKSPVFLCSFLPDKIECCSLDLEFEEDDNVVFSVLGSRSIHLAGNFIVDDGDSDSCGDCCDTDSSGEDIAGTDTDDSNEFSDEEESGDDFIDDVDMFPTSSVPNKGVVIEEIVDDDKPSDVNGQSNQPKKRKKKNQLGDSAENKSSQEQIVLKSGSSVPVLGSEDEDGFPSSTQKSEVSVNKADLQTEQTKKNTTDKIKTKKVKFVVEPSTSVKRKIENADQDGQPESEPQSEEKKKKKKAWEGEDLISKEKTVPAVANKGASTAKVEKPTVAKPSLSRTFDNGLVIEELAMGKPNGKKASPGNQVCVRYTGKLQKNGKIFDSNVGRRPFKFRLGVGEVIRGWDVGVDGLRVGGRRRLTIPPSMGYGAKGAGQKIPPNSWLVFDVELVEIRGF